MILTVISRTMAALSETLHALPPGRVQRKHASLSLAREAALLTPSNPRKALAIFKEYPVIDIYGVEIANDELVVDIGTAL